jgi:integrase
LSCRSRLVSFTLKNSCTMKVARHLLFNRTGSRYTLYSYISDFYYFSRWLKAEPDQLMNRCRNKNGDTSSKGVVRMTSAIDEYIDQLQAKNLSPATIRSRMKNITIIFRINDIGIKLPYGLSVWNLSNERAPSREELLKILDLADLREKAVITILAVSGLRVGTLLRLQYRHVKSDLEQGIIPIHIHIESEVTKGKHRSYDTFLNEEASDYLRAYLDSRRMGTKKIPPEQISDESPLIRTHHCRQVKTVAIISIWEAIHDLYARSGLLKRNSAGKRYDLRTHSLRRFFRTQMASLEVDPDFISYMMGRAVKDRYHDVRMKGVEYLRGMYMTSGIRVRPKIKLNKIDALKEILQTWGLDPQKILTHEALAQITPTTKLEQTDNSNTTVVQQNSKNHQSSDPLPRSTGVFK